MSSSKKTWGIYHPLMLFQWISVHIYKFPILNTLKIPHSSDSILVELRGYNFSFLEKKHLFLGELYKSYRLLTVYWPIY